MGWWLEWGSYADKLPKTAPALQNQPHLISGLEIYFQAFFDLRTERISESGIIPWGAIIKWAEFNEIIEKEEIKRLMRYIRAMELEERKRKK